VRAFTRAPRLKALGTYQFGPALTRKRVTRERIVIETQELYSSPNGDRWLLARDPGTGEVFIRHEPNGPSGGQPSHLDIGSFLNRGPRNPEHRALLHLIGTLIGSRSSDFHGFE
jgi:hypothetical protein